jgi:hypothetical protein
MSESQVSEPAPASMSRADQLSVSFAQLVMQQANMATMFLGKTPHPETGQVMMNLDAARLFIDQLEMLEVKTKGNLDKDEAALLKQSLMSLRLAFVEAVEAAPQPEAQTQPSSEPAPTPAEPAPGGAAPAPAEDEHRKKFTKKY